MDSLLVEADQRARIVALDPARSFIVQAPAGSGKTELLIQRFLRLLALVDEPEEVLAITFTRKAAQEMHQRVIEALRAVAVPTVTLEKHRQITMDAARAALARSEALGWQLMATPGRLRIQTLDSFNSGIARSLPVTSGLGGIKQTVADAEMSNLYRLAASASLDWIAESKSIGKSVTSVLAHLDSNVNAYVTYVARMLQNRDQWLELVGSGTQLKREGESARGLLEDNIGRAIEAQLSRAHSLFPVQFQEELCGLLAYSAEHLPVEHAENGALQVLRGLSHWPGKSLGDTATWQAITALLLVKSGGFRKSANVKIGFPAKDDGQKKAFIEILQRLSGLDDLCAELNRVRLLPPPCYSNAQWNVLVALFEVLPIAVAELRRLFAEKSICDHIEVSLAAGSALGSDDNPGDMTLILDKQIKHLLVDEMQDTSLGQYRLLEKITSGWTPNDGRTFFGVGDPMQSIYRFREAEVAQFVVTRDSGLNTLQVESLLLRKNFRSGEYLVHWFNTAFGQIMPQNDDLATGAIAYAESVPALSDAGELQILPLIDNTPREEADVAADAIGDCLANHSDESVVVLVRSRPQLTELLTSLRTRSISYQGIEIDRLTDLPEIIDLLALTRALCHDADRIAWLGLLHGPMVGLSWMDIVALVAGNLRSTVLELMDDSKRRVTLSEDGQSRSINFAGIMSKHMLRPGAQSLRNRVENCWFELGGPGILKSTQQLDNVYHFLDVIEKLEQHGTLPDVSELESLLDQERVTSRVEDSCRLQIMTMHKAKGLQFDHVVLYGLGRGSRANQKSVLSWLNLTHSDRSDIIVSPVGSRNELDQDPLHQFIESTESLKQRNELDRLLYVACTRARKTLTIIGNVASTSTGEQLTRPRKDSLLNRLWPVVQSAFEEAFSQQSQAQRGSGKVSAVNSKKPICQRYATPWETGEAPALPSRGLELQAPATQMLEEVEYQWVGTQARQAGTIVHRWLQRMTPLGSDALALDLEYRAKISRRWARQLGVPQQDLEDVCARVSVALDGMLGDEKGRWLLAGAGHAELALTGIWNGTVSSIVIDRIRVDEDGIHWIVDYKTSSHEGADVEHFLDDEARRYRQQLEKYMRLYSATTDQPVRTALYFPMLQAFREVSLDQAN